jgi:hypothetical protein
VYPAAAVLLRGAMKTMVYNVDTLDPVTYVIACFFLVAATIAAVSSRRAGPRVSIRPSRSASNTI